MRLRRRGGSVRRAGGAVRAERLLRAERRRQQPHRQAAALQGGRRLGQPRGLHAAVESDAHRLRLGPGAGRAQPADGAEGLGAGGAGRTGGGLPRLHGVRLQPVRAGVPRAGGGGQPEPHPSGPLPRHPSALPLRRLRRAERGVEPGGGGPDRGARRRGLGALGTAVDAGRLEPAHRGHHPGLVLGLLLARLGRLVVLGPGGERQLHALAGGHGAAALGGGDGEARGVAGLDHLPGAARLSRSPCWAPSWCARAC